MIDFDDIWQKYAKVSRIEFACFSFKIRFKISKFASFSVSGLKDEKLIKKQIYIKTETCKLFSRVFWIYLPNFIKIDPYIDP